MIVPRGLRGRGGVIASCWFEVRGGVFITWGGRVCGFKALLGEGVAFAVIRVFCIWPVEREFSGKLQFLL